MANRVKNYLQASGDCDILPLMANHRIRKDIQSKGGHARALSMSPKRRKQIARAAAQARWRRPKPQ